jgi:hypothetical protein
MKLGFTSVMALAAAGVIAGVGAASACDFHKNDVTATAIPAPAQEQIATPVAIDSVVVAESGQVAILPTAPKEEEADVN